MSKRFDIFMRSLDDELLEEAQLGIPKRRGFVRIAGLAACLCVVVGAYYMSFGGFGAKSESSAVPENLYATTAAASAQTTMNESYEIMTTAATEATARLPAPTEAGVKKSLLPANAVVCSFSVTDTEKQIDFSVGDMDFTLTSSENDVNADKKLRNVLISDKANETITWYSDDGDTKYTLELIEGDYDLLYSTAEEIAENLGIEIG